MSAMHRYATVQHEGVVTHYLVPSAELERLLSASRDKPAATFAWSPDVKQSDFARDVLTDRKTRWESADQLMLELVSEGLREMRERIRVGKISGAVGTHAHLDPEVERIVCEFSFQRK